MGSPGDAASPGEPDLPEGGITGCVFESCAYVLAGEDEGDLACAQKDLVSCQPQGSGVEWWALRHELLRPGELTVFERDDHRDLFAAVGMLCRERGEEVGDLMQQTGTERLNLQRRRVLSPDQQRGVPTQPLLRGAADPDLSEFGVGDAQLDPTLSASALKPEPIALNNKRPGRGVSPPGTKHHRIARGSWLAATVHRTSISLTETCSIRSLPPTVCMIAARLAVVASCLSRRQ